MLSIINKVIRVEVEMVEATQEIHNLSAALQHRDSNLRGEYVDSKDRCLLRSPTTSSGPRYATPGTFAAVKGSTSGQDDYTSISYLFQDINSPDIYLWTIIKGQDWVEIGKITGLDPPPKANSSFAAIQTPDSDTISIYYAAENGTLFDASGSSTGTNWQNGVMARRTNFGILVSEGSGIAASWWGLKDQEGPGFSLRIYYVDSAASRIRELAFDNDKNPQWFVTEQSFETCSPTAKIGLAHLPPNATSSDRETVHLFYQNTAGDLRHYPGYDGSWDLDNGEGKRPGHFKSAPTALVY
ncbi:hypothetical protein AA313_de0205957 [Arthrobotrys entomopaga]|nr:hypothetical protein AA313_de0205957 [Arthrobotrys entomopaga]